MGVPAAAARDVEAAHDLVAREHVLEGSRQDMVNPGAAVGGGRPLIEDELGPAAALLNGLVEDVLALPECQYSVLHGGDVQLCGDGLEE